MTFLPVTSATSDDQAMRSFPRRQGGNTGVGVDREVTPLMRNGRVTS